MKLFRLTRKPETGEEEKELVLDTDAEETAAEAAAPAQDTTDAEVTVPKAEGGPPQEDDSLDPALLDIFHEAENEAQENTPASELDDIPIQDLLSDLVGVSRRLGITPQARAEPACDEALDADAEPAEEGDAAEPDGSWDSQTEEPSLTGYRRYALHGLFLGLALTAAIGAFVGAEQLARTGPTPTPTAQSQAGHSPPIVVVTVPNVVATQEGQAETAVDPTLDGAPEPTPEATPEPTPELQPAYFLYTVQPGDNLFDIAQAFGISLDYILWNNPDIIYDPNLVLVGEELMLPSTDGIIYHVKPGDTLADIATLYQIDVESIVAFVPNGLTSLDNAIEGMVLILPGAVPPSLPRPPQVVEPTASEPQRTEPAPTPEAPTPSEPQAMEPTPTPEAPTPSEPQAMEPTPTAEESPSFSIGHISP